MKFLAAAVQMLASSDKAANLDEARRWVRAAAAKGARVIALPEVFIWRGSKKRREKGRRTDSRTHLSGTGQSCP